MPFYKFVTLIINLTVQYQRLPEQSFFFAFDPNVNVNAYQISLLPFCSKFMNNAMRICFFSFSPKLEPTTTIIFFVFFTTVIFYPQHVSIKTFILTEQAKLVITTVEECALIKHDVIFVLLC